MAWERDFLANEARSTSMTFEQFVKVYAEDVRPRLRETTWRSKEYMINEKLIPFFGKMRVVDITSREVMDWQNDLLKARDKNGKKYSETYIMIKADEEFFTFCNVCGFSVGFSKCISTAGCQTGRQESYLQRFIGSEKGEGQ